MNYRTYTTNTPKISQIGFGAWQLGNKQFWGEMSDQEAIRLVHEALDYGINYFDTAPGYGNGNSERLIGLALKNHDRSKVVINTKFGHTADGREDFNASSIIKAVEDSCKRLQTDYIDSILLHNPSESIYSGQSKEHYEILEELKSQGKIKAYGASLDNSKDMIAFINGTKGEVIEALFNINFQGARDAFDLAKEKNVAIVAKVPLDSGWLTGKYNQKSTFTGIRDRWSLEDIKTRAEIIDMIRTLPESPQTMSQFALAFCLSYDAVTTVIPGCKNIDQLKNNVNSLHYKMTETMQKRLENLYEKNIKPMHLPW